MQMKKLGKGQSVVFCIPDEIQTKIRAVADKGDEETIHVSDVLIWSIHETYADLRKSMPLWATQGARFERQEQAWQKARTDTGIALTNDQADRFLEKEALSLEDRYRPREALAIPEIFGDLQSSSQLQEIYERCKLFDSVHFASATLQEEQERELSAEIEAERQIERPREADPLPHELHKDVQAFVHTGQIPPGSAAFMKAFQAFANTSATTHFDVKKFPCDLLVTRDFVRTVRVTGKGGCTDDYQRPVQWILTSHGEMVVISPFEAARLRSAIKESPAVIMHLYAPLPNLAYKPLDGLDLFTVPPLPSDWKAFGNLTLQLNLFAGQLYFSSFEEYKRLCEFLCLAWRKMDDDVPVQADGFVVPQAGTSQAFGSSPTKFLQVVVTKMRRNGEGIDKTHYGKVLAGELLGESDFQDVPSATPETS